jgi:hypothetical protein
LEHRSFTSLSLRTSQRRSVAIITSRSEVDILVREDARVRLRRAHQAYDRPTCAKTERPDGTAGRPLPIRAKSRKCADAEDAPPPPRCRGFTRLGGFPVSRPRPRGRGREDGSLAVRTRRARASALRPFRIRDESKNVRIVLIEGNATGDARIDCRLPMFL